MKTKTYSINFAVSINDKATAYPEVKPIDLRITENLPINVDPHKHLRARIGEELSRAFAVAGVVIDNKTEDAVADDPLTVL